MPGIHEAYQLSHLGWGIALPLLALLFLRPRLAVYGFAALVLAKEFVWDLWIEGDSLAGSLLDASVYFAGLAIGMTAQVLAGNWTVRELLEELCPACPWILWAASNLLLLAAVTLWLALIAGLKTLLRRDRRPPWDSWDV